MISENVECGEAIWGSPLVYLWCQMMWTFSSHTQMRERKLGWLSLVSFWWSYFCLHHVFQGQGLWPWCGPSHLSPRRGKEGWLLLSSFLLRTSLTSVSPGCFRGKDCGHDVDPLNSHPEKGKGAGCSSLISFQWSYFSLPLLFQGQGLWPWCWPTHLTPGGGKGGWGARKTDLQAGRETPHTAGPTGGEHLQPTRSHQRQQIHDISTWSLRKMDGNYDDWEEPGSQKQIWGIRQWIWGTFQWCMCCGFQWWWNAERSTVPLTSCWFSKILGCP